MKHPREVLFERHRTAEPRLDAIRTEILTGSRNAPALAPHRKETPPATRSLLHELFLPFRWHLAGMTAAWVLTAILNMDPSPAETRNIAGQAVPPPRQLLAALRENRRQIAELLESSARLSEPASEPPAFAPKRRSELQPSSVMA